MYVNISINIYSKKRSREFAQFQLIFSYKTPQKDSF